MEPDAKLTELLKQRDALKQEMKQELKDTQKQLQDAQRKRKEVLEKQIRTAQTRVSARERKDETRRKIIIGALILHQIAERPESKPLLLADLDAFVQRDRERALFGLPPRPPKEGSE